VSLEIRLQLLYLAEGGIPRKFVYNRSMSWLTPQLEETLAEMLRKKFQIQHKASVWKLCQHYNLLKEVRTNSHQESFFLTHPAHPFFSVLPPHAYFLIRFLSIFLLVFPFQPSYFTFLPLIFSPYACSSFLTLPPPSRGYTVHHSVLTLSKTEMFI
jgi:hypothetical protein